MSIRTEVSVWESDTWHEEMCLPAILWEDNNMHTSGDAYFGDGRLDWTTSKDSSCADIYTGS